MAIYLSTKTKIKGSDLMGTSGAMDTSNQYVKYKITITQNWQDVSSNTTNVTVKVNFHRTNSSYQTYGTGVCYCKIDGTTYSASVLPSQKITSSGIDLFTKTIAIYHNGNGSKYLDTSAWISLDTPLTSSEQWYGEWLPTIPRASQPSLSSSSVTMGNSVTVYTNRASSSFTHVLYYQLSGGGWNWIVSNVGTSYNWTIPLNFANNVPNGTGLSVTMICETYNGSTYIGVKSVNLTANVPSSLVPTISDISLSESVSGIYEKFGTYVQGKSQINGIISASGTYSSTIKNYSISINGQSFSSSNFTTNALTGNGSCNVTVTDTRNRTASGSQSYSVTAYSNPSISNFTVVRCNSDGVENDEGAYAKCSMTANISQVDDKNDKEFQLLYKKTADSSYTTINLDNINYSYNNSYILPVDVNSEYNFIFRITDYFGSTEKSSNLGTAFTLMDFNSNGRSIAFGKVSTALSAETKMEVAMDIEQENYFNGRRMQYIPNGIGAANGWYLVLIGQITPQWDNHAFTLNVTQTYSGATGILYANVRSDNYVLSITNFNLLSSGGLGLSFGNFKIRIDGNHYYLYAKTTANYQMYLFEVISESTLATKSNTPIFDFNAPNYNETVSEPSGTTPTSYGPFILYNNPSGTNETITLSETAANFSFISIYYGEGANENIERRIYNPNGKTTNLSKFVCTDAFYFKCMTATISGTTISFSQGGYMYAYNGSSPSVSTGTYGLSVTRVIGYR